MGAEARLRRFRRATLLAVAVTGLFLILWGLPADVPGQEPVAAPVDPAPAAAGEVIEAPADPAAGIEEATGTVRQLASDFVRLLPGILVALFLIVAAAVLVRLVRAVLRRALGQWERADAATAMSGVIIWILAVGAALSVVAGDARALAGSVGLLGLALSWALQAPIESFAGWLLNSFKGYYRVGDRIAVGDVLGDVYRIDALNTTVWEIGGPDKPVQGAQPTGALITFPNSDVLRANITNFTRGFPYVWDEVTINVANESDLAYAMEALHRVACDTIGPAMVEPVRTYRLLLEKQGLGLDIAEEPQVYVSPAESWTDVTIRYLVNARERRKWSSELLLRISQELAKEEHGGRIIDGYPVIRYEHGRGTGLPIRPTDE